MKTIDKPREMLTFQVFVLVLMLVFLAIPASADKELSLAGRTGVVAVDPGHGGKDKGASGPTGLLEKNIVLELARQLALELEADFRVTLTRSGDYGVEPRQRTAIANHANADLMISLHAGAGFRHTTQGQAIYYHTGPSNGDALDGEMGQTDTQRSWHLTQNRHTQASQTLARIMQQQLENIPSQGPIQIQGAPLVVLQGADHPAVLIELGHITNPDTEKALAAPEHMSLLIKTIARGINQFMDLHAQSVTR